MTSNIRRVIREPLKLQRLRRNYRQQQGVFRKTYLAAVNGRVLGTKLGHLWVHDAASADGTGNVTYGAPYQLPIKPGASIAHRPNWKVNVVTIEGDEFIESMDVNEMLRANYDPHQTNPLDPSLQFKLIENLQNLQAFPNGDETVRVMPSIYRKSDGTYDVFAAIDVDILTGNVPSADNQVVVCLWLKVDNTIEITVSSEEPVSTNLKLDPTTALTLINECAAAAPVGSLGIWSFIIWDDTTAITGINKFHDLRGIVGSGIHSILDNLTATTAPTINDDSADGYSVGSRWFDVTNDKIYLCIDATVGAAIWIEIVGRTQIQTLTNKTISASANTISTGAAVIKTLAADIAAAGTDRNLIIAAQTGTTDNLIEVTGLTVGESVLLVADAGDTITVKHNDSGATVKIHLHGNADITLDEQNPLRLTLIATNVLSEDVQSSGGTTDIVADTLTLNDWSTLEIVEDGGGLGEITVTHAIHIVDTEGDVSPDDLDTVNGLAVGQVCIIYPENDARPIWVKHGTGNLATASGQDIYLSSTERGCRFTGRASDVIAEALSSGFTITGDDAETVAVQTGDDLEFSGFSGIQTSIAGGATPGKNVEISIVAGLISAKSELTSVDHATDMLLIYDDSAGTLKKSKPVNASNPYVADGIVLTDPTLQTWNNLNHGAGTYTENTTKRRMTIVEDGDGTADLRGWYAAAPSVPYTITMHVKAWLGDTNGNGFAVGFRENATTELHVIEFFDNAADTVSFRVSKWNSPTSLNSAYVGSTAVGLCPTWIKLEDNNTNRIISISNDGIAWSVIHSIGRTDFLTADGIFFGVFVTTASSFDTTASLLSYEV